MYFRISSKNMLSPARFTITYKESVLDKGRKPDLRLSISLNTKEPNEHEH